MQNNCELHVDIEFSSSTESRQGKLSLEYKRDVFHKATNKYGECVDYQVNYQGWVIFGPKDLIDKLVMFIKEQFQSQRNLSVDPEIYAKEQDRTGIAFADSSLSFSALIEEEKFDYFETMKAIIYQFFQQQISENLLEEKNSNNVTDENLTNNNSMLTVNLANNFQGITNFDKFINSFKPNNQGGILENPFLAAKSLKKFSKAKYIAAAIAFAIIAALFINVIIFNLAALAAPYGADASNVIVSSGLQAFQAMARSLAVSSETLVGLAAIAGIAFAVAAIIFAYKAATAAAYGPQSLADNEKKTTTDVISNKDSKILNSNYFGYQAALAVSILVSLGLLFVFAIGVTAILFNSGIDTGPFGTLVENMGFSKMMERVATDLVLGIITAASFFLAILCSYVGYRSLKKIDEINIENGEFPIMAQMYNFFQPVMHSLNGQLLAATNLLKWRVHDDISDLYSQEDHHPFTPLGPRRQDIDSAPHSDEELDQEAVEQPEKKLSPKLTEEVNYYEELKQESRSSSPVTSLKT